MHPSLIFLLLLLLPSSLADSSLPPGHHSRFSQTVRPRRSSQPPREYIEVRRPLPNDSVTPSCTLAIVSHTFGNTSDRPPNNATYSNPRDCTWSSAVLHLSAASNGSQHGRIAAVWLAGAEILRTSTPESTTDGTFWNVYKDVTKYSSLLRQSNATLTVMLDNAVDAVYNGVYRLNLTFLFFDGSSNGTDAPAPATAPAPAPAPAPATVPAGNIPFSLFPPNWKLGGRPAAVEMPMGAIVSPDFSTLKETPANLIIPISANGDGGFWFKIPSEYDFVRQDIKIPLNTYRAMIEVYVSSHGNDEFWYSNPPDSYFELNHLPSKSGHGSFREVVVKIDNEVVGSVVPFPVIFSGGINPEFWDPVASIGAFDMPSYEIELTPFLGILLDGNAHSWGLGVADALPFWLVDANLHLWLDNTVDRVQAGPITFGNPSKLHVKRELKFQQLDGEFLIEGKRKSMFSGWVNSSAGNITTYVSTRLRFENTVKFKKNGTEKGVEQRVKTSSKVTLKSESGERITRCEVDRKYPLEMTIITLAGSGDDNYLRITKLEHSIEEEVKNATFKSTLANSQKSSGWAFMEGQNVVSGAAITRQSYEYEDDLGCYTRKVLADGGSIKLDTEDFQCLEAAAAS